MDLVALGSLAVSAVGVINDLLVVRRDLNEWMESDVEVDSSWLALAIQSGKLTGTSSDYVWALKKKVPSLELAGTHLCVLVLEDEKRTKYRVTRGGHGPGQLFLLRKL